MSLLELQTKVQLFRQVCSSSLDIFQIFLYLLQFRRTKTLSQHHLTLQIAYHMFLHDFTLQKNENTIFYFLLYMNHLNEGLTVYRGKKKSCREPSIVIFSNLNKYWKKQNFHLQTINAVSLNIKTYISISLYIFLRFQVDEILLRVIIMLIL